MRQSKLHCRTSLTPQDMAFVESAMNLPVGNWNNTASRDEMLDAPALFDVLMETQSILPISMGLYFYVLMRRALQEAAIDSRDIADYTASMLVHATQTKKVGRLYVMDELKSIGKAEASDAFHMRIQLADTCLLLTGLFDDHLQRRVDRRAAPRSDYYESIGQEQYGIVSRHRIADEHAMDDLFGAMSESFPTVRSALQALGERLTFLGDDFLNPNILE